MADKKGNLYIFEAIELRAEYDQKIKLIEQLLSNQTDANRWSSNDSEEKEPVADFVVSEFQKRLKNLQTKRVKLNQAIQEANFKYTIRFDSEEISLSEALEVRKNLLAEKSSISDRVKESAYKRIIHKEERDVVRTARYSFTDSYGAYLNVLEKLKKLINKIHLKNHECTVNFRDE